LNSRTPAVDYAGARVVVMGLGLNGGGLASARFLAARGADVTVTDLRDATVLAPSIAQLEGLPIRYVLGRHDPADFAAADFVVKNPAVKPDSPFLAASRRVETDLSIFLAHCPARLSAVTGSKGKSSTASALHWTLSRAHGRSGGTRRAYLGGNITVSPLSFLEELRPEDDVVLELSSWQLGDLKGRRRPDGRPLLKPRAALLTAILPDHLDRYGTMEAYVADKRLIYAGQDQDDATVVADDAWGDSFAAQTAGRVLRYAKAALPFATPGAWIADPDGPGYTHGPTASSPPREIVPAAPLTPGKHQKRNLLAAAAAAIDLGIAPEDVLAALSEFAGIEHRLEFFHGSGSVLFYNDSAATIPEAAAAAVEAFGRPPVLVTGGTDKALDFAPLAEAAAKAKAVTLLAGTGSVKLAAALDAAGIAFSGPFDQLDDAVRAALAAAAPGDPVVLSPGCASFGMFLNEFDRGRRWKEAVRRLAP
jgi:UDP-N-acetylmuramoylalanine--D-glutamate ligase